MKLLQLFCNFFDCIRFLIFEILLLCLKKSNFSVPLFLSLYFFLVLFNMFAFDCQGADVFLEKLIVTLIIVLCLISSANLSIFFFIPRNRIYSSQAYSAMKSRSMYTGSMCSQHWTCVLADSSAHKTDLGSKPGISIQHFL